MTHRAEDCQRETLFFVQARPGGGMARRRLAGCAARTRTKQPLDLPAPENALATALWLWTLIALEPLDRIRPRPSLAGARTA